MATEAVAMQLSTKTKTNMIVPEKLCREISEAYLSCGNTMGWRLLYSPPSVLQISNVAFIGLNPGGSLLPNHHADFAMTSGSAYRDEEWENYRPGESPLQKQVLKLFERLGSAPDSVLAGNLVPWRSHTWHALANKAEALAFGSRIWSQILSNANPRIVVTMGADTGRYVQRLLDMPKFEKVALDWGGVSAKRCTNGSTKMICLPHLSRFRIMSRRKCQEALDRLFDF